MIAGRLAGGAWRSLSFAGVLLLGSAWIAFTDAFGWPLWLCVAPAVTLLTGHCCRDLARATRRPAQPAQPATAEEPADNRPRAYHAVNRAAGL